MKKFNLFISLSMLILIFACDEDNLPEDCPTELICTEQLISITFAPLDDNNEPVILDSYYSQNLDNGKTYSFAEEGLQSEPGKYTVITDLELEDLRSNGTTIRFNGVVGGSVVLQQDFLVGHDCCHIVRLEGPGVQ